MAEKQKQKGMYVKFPEKLKVALQLLAVEKHMGYQTYLKMVLADHIAEQVRLGRLSEDMIDAALDEVSNG